MAETQSEVDSSWEIGFRDTHLGEVGPTKLEELRTLGKRRMVFLPSLKDVCYIENRWYANPRRPASALRNVGDATA